MSGVKVSDYPTATTLVETDLVYLVQSSGSAKVSKKSTLTTLFNRVFSKTIFNKGINYGTTPQTLTNTGTIDIQIGITALICTANGSFILPAGTQGDEKIILVENNPSFVCMITGTFSTGNSFNVGLGGGGYSFVFHSGKWYKK